MPRYAAIDIGSNSIRMLAADVTPGRQMAVLEADRVITRLGASVFRAGAISDEAMGAACAVLRRMAAAYQRHDLDGVRIVATAAVRDASNRLEFIERAAEAAGAPIDIVSGQEEARLIHLGVQSKWPHPRHRVLIVDIGGGSAEIIHSENGQMMEAFSRPLGAVRLTGVFLDEDPPEEMHLHQMIEFIDEKLAKVVERLGRIRPDRVIGTSATAAALVCAVNRIPRARREEADRLRATLPQVRGLFGDLAGRKREARAKITGVGPRRAEIIVAGVAVMLRILEKFTLPSVYYSTAGVREGIVADLAARRVGRELSRLSRDQRLVVEQLARKFNVSLKHAKRVAEYAHDLFEPLRPLHGLSPYCGKLLEAACYLYDSGHYISDTAHHKHSSYIVENSDLPGFTDQERRLIAMLCRYHRKSAPSARHVGFEAMPAEERRVVLRLIPLLRLADALDRSKEQRVRAIEVTQRNGSVALVLRSEQDVDLEAWAAKRTGQVFEQTFGIPLLVSRTRR